MKKIFLVLSITLVALVCKEGVAVGDKPTVEEAKSFLKPFLSQSANHTKMSQNLIPQDEDCQKFFTDSSLAKNACATYKEMLSRGGIKPNAGQTELLVWQATAAELVAGSGDSGNFPGGYKNVADKINPQQVIFAFKFVKPGEKLGMAYDGLTAVNGKWRIFPKPWRLIKE